MSARARQRPCVIQTDVLFWKEKGGFFGHCLQFDIVSTGQTLEEVRDQMRRLILAHVNYVEEHDNWDYLYRPAPQEIWQRFALAERRAQLPRWTERPSTTAIEWLANNSRVNTRFAYA